MTAGTRRAETAGSDPPIGLSSHNPEVALATVLAGAGIGALEAFIRELGLPAYIDGFTDTLYNEY